ncbi:unnamed protein product [Amoebophrya sp. A25]|nr:unnamed protein product [Amoebophrya sp. A25]|eukprot:GSA25T00007038001.1
MPPQGPLAGALDFFNAISEVIGTEENADEKASKCCDAFKDACHEAGPDEEKFLEVFKNAEPGLHGVMVLRDAALKFYQGIKVLANAKMERDGHREAVKLVETICNIFKETGTEAEDVETFVRTFETELDEQVDLQLA